jgi:hypothetical protein
MLVAPLIAGPSKRPRLARVLHQAVGDDQVVEVAGSGHLLAGHGTADHDVKLVAEAEPVMEEAPRRGDLLTGALRGRLEVYEETSSSPAALESNASTARESYVAKRTPRYLARSQSTTRVRSLAYRCS